MSWNSNVDVAAAEAQLTKHALEVFEKYEFNCFPLFPNVLVRVLDPADADRVQGRILLAQTVAKPYVNAVVLRSWAEKEFAGKTYGSELTPGQLVKMPYWGGIPMDPYATDDSKYRVVPENMLADVNRKSIMARGASQEFPHIFVRTHLYDPFEVALQLVKSVDEHLGNRIDIAKELLQKYTIMPKEKVNR